MNWWPFSDRARREREELRARVSLDREGNEQIERISRVVHRVHWMRNLLSIIWTAGPVTLLGLYGGFFLAYGKPPPTQTLVYFFFFTVLSGLIAFLAKVVYDMTRGHVKEQAQQDVSEAIDKLADLILAVRDLIVESFEEEARQREAALQLLRRIELTPDGVAFAAQELTGDSELARILGRIETYRRAGLYSRVRDFNRQYRERIENALTELQEVSPEAASVLRERFSGEAPQLEKGVPRDEFFIERVLAAIEEDNLLLMTLQDVEEMLILAFELINGREIPMLIFSYSGQWKLAKALDELENSRSQYRIAQASGSNRMRALAGFLVETDEATHEQLPNGLSAQELISRIEELLDRLAGEVQQLARQARHRQLDSLSVLRTKADVLAKSLNLYKAARQGYQQLGKAHATLLEASDDWNHLAERFGDAASQLQLGPGRRGLRILEKVVSLSDEQKVEVCQHLVNYLQGAQLEKRGRRFFTRRDGRSRPLTLEGARELAVEVALALEPHIQLSRPAIQRGLNATNATYLGGLEPDMSAAEKAALGSAMAREVQQDMRHAAERLAVALVRHYRVDLTEEARNFLIDAYGARPQMLDLLSNYEATSANTPVSFLSLRPPIVAAPRREWYKALIKARQELG
ncbi:hypothetical protein [Marinospirillum alkaliphilum]|uniref:Uncharacterized protein n=1 Tax=Marinospirillum alkaliphilum DSM 21637 TaxID=1122209 RepID=A0A1K1YME0_9GAMM|nr:hypothetical protein [Marinospirillum alkaliphilum]SFX62516.1 hypothetical protein SAMN02745752_02297 [Marinospirillum alkaliphilum DSM 21637]